MIETLMGLVGENSKAIIEVGYKILLSILILPSSFIVSRIFQKGIRKAGNKYDKFDETFYNTVFACHEVVKMLQNRGFHEVYCADISDLGKPVVDPEKLSRVYFVAES